MEIGTYNHLIESFLNYKGVGFVSLNYRSKDGELSKRLMNIGAIYENAKKKDLELILSDGIQYVKSDKYSEFDWEAALWEIESSLMNNHVENPRSTGQTQTYIILHDNNGSLRFNVNTQEIYLFGKCEKKIILEEGNKKKYNSSPKTLAKEEIKKQLKSSKFRLLILKNLTGTVKVNKEIININGKDTSADVLELITNEQ